MEKEEKKGEFRLMTMWCTRCAFAPIHFRVVLAEDCLWWAGQRT